MGGSAEGARGGTLNTTHELQENTAGRVQLGCSTLIAFLAPTWLLTTALMLQFMPELRGVEMFDPQTGTTTFVTYGAFYQWFWGGLLSLTLLQVGVPVLGQAVYLMALGDAASTAYADSQARAYEAAVGRAELPVPLTVRKRTKGGARAAAVPVEVVGAGLIRRLMARLADTALLAQGIVAALWLGHLLTVGLSLPAVFSPTMLGLAALSSVGFFAFRWRSVARSGHAVGKALAGIEVLQWDGENSSVWRLLARTVLPDVVLLAGAIIGAVSVGQFVVPMVLEAPWGQRLDPGRFGVIAQVVGGIGVHLALQIVGGLPALVGDRSLYDRLAGTWVARSELVSVGSGDGEGVLTLRVIARLVDGAFLAALVAIPLLVASATGGWYGLVEGEEGSSLVFSPWLWGVPVALLIGEGVHLADLSIRGTTMGKRLLGLHIVDAERDTPVPWFQRVLIREVVCVALFWTLLPVLAPLYDLFTGAMDQRQRTLHDWIAGTRVVRSPGR